MARSSKQNSRRKAAFIVTRWLLTHEFPVDLLPNEGEDRAFIQDLVYTTVRRFRPLRTILGKLVTKHWPKGELEALLLIGGAQILYMDEVPDFAAVNETVLAARACENPSIAKVVNGTLRNLIRRREEFEGYLKTAELAERESYPNALVKRWVQRYGEENAEKLALWHNTPGETWLAYKPDDSHEAYVKLARGEKVVEQPGFKDGAFIVQDPATALAIELLDVKKGQKVLDACAAPGGKTVQIAWRLGGENSRLLANEVNPRRMGKLRQNLKRMKLDWVETCGFELSDPRFAKAAGCKFDRILVDVPCSNTGVLRRRPDARWRWDIEHLKELTSLQAQILENAAGHLASGGIMVYSTCSNEPEENAAQVEAFLAKHPEFEEIARKESLPFETHYDGAFAAALRKR